MVLRRKKNPLFRSGWTAILYADSDARDSVVATTGTRDQISWRRRRQGHEGGFLHQVERKASIRAKLSREPVIRMRPRKEVTVNVVWESDYFSRGIADRIFDPWVRSRHLIAEKNLRILHDEFVLLTAQPLIQLDLFYSTSNRLGLR